MSKFNDNSRVRTYFDSYGDLRFSTIEGVLIYDRSPLMDELLVISELMSSDDELHEILDNYEGSIKSLHNTISRKYFLVR